MPECSGASFIGTDALYTSYHVIARVCVTGSNLQFLIDSRRRAGISERYKERGRERERERERERQSRRSVIFLRSPLLCAAEVYFLTIRELYFAQGGRKSSPGLGRTIETAETRQSIRAADRWDARAIAQRAKISTRRRSTTISPLSEDERANAPAALREKRRFLPRGVLQLRCIAHRRPECASGVKGPRSAPLDARRHFADTRKAQVCFLP